MNFGHIQGAHCQEPGVYRGLIPGNAAVAANFRFALVH